MDDICFWVVCCSFIQRELLACKIIKLSANPQAYLWKAQEEQGGCSEESVSLFSVTIDRTKREPPHIEPGKVYIGY